ncbi:MAG: hypothetical protein ABI621_08480 [Chloroflexota bacterium]
MESDTAVIGALLFILLIIVANFAMYAIARGATKGGNSRWMSALKDGLSKPLESKANKSMDELRQKVDELKKNNNQED